MRVEKFLEDRFGMFIHWGAYSTSGRHEWLKMLDRLTTAEYQKYVDAFNPKEDCIREWARLAKIAGMKYVVMTTKHHDGYCLFKSEYTDYTTYETIGRDLVAEYVDAFRAEGIQIGFYYSLIDWHHFDYPHFDDMHHPQRDDESEKENEAKRDFKNYLRYMRNQVTELLTNYGKIDIMWFDFSYDKPRPDSLHPDMKGETWEPNELVSLVRKLQPDIIINNRLERNGVILEGEPKPYAGDFTSPEQILPPEGMTNNKGEPIPWEACVTMTSSWCYTQNHHTHKQTKTLLRSLIECVSKNGNLLLNVGPAASGEIPENSRKALLEIGEWMADNAESIYGAYASNYPKPDWGRYTAKNGKLYAHIYERGIGPIPLIGLEGKIKSAKLLKDDTLLSVERPWNAGRFPNDAFLHLPWDAYLPDEFSTVVELTLAD